MNIIGAFCFLFSLTKAYKIRIWNGLICAETHGDWGGFSMGVFVVTCEYPGDSLLRHEAGHSIQNIMFGPLMPFVVAIPSAIRYWYREYLVRSGKKFSVELPDYDAIWFEGMATKLGEKYFE